MFINIFMHFLKEKKYSTFNYRNTKSFDIHRISTLTEQPKQSLTPLSHCQTSLFMKEKIAHQNYLKEVWDIW
jgi:hypothetical protein